MKILGLWIPVSFRKINNITLKYWSNCYSDWYFQNGIFITINFQCDWKDWKVYIYVTKYQERKSQLKKINVIHYGDFSFRVNLRIFCQQN